ncbi:flagellar biosynthetic protein FliR [Allochromatium palmeri]|uniref:Flagellar biosynthetic protein FliR n=1 Tax=Allochromatium palmeri TaxID=231048 RepID=A0A6N8E7T8_9GAMM|nr:flagellar biosynthetic protein FliR [Allochromatium palmeri]MTW20323.1 flagellar biosynthetic protein FliR [Allochromatium palmeri]
MSTLTFEANDILRWAVSLAWPFVRISAMLLVVPVFGARQINTRVRLGLALLLAFLIMPQLPEVPAIDPLSVGGVVVAIQQALIGIGMGFILTLVFSAINQAGEAIALSMGLGFASAVDPIGGVQVPMISQYLSILATLIFLAMNGHLVLFDLLLRSFETFPIGSGGPESDDFWHIASFGSRMFAGAMLIALPAVASLLLVNLAMGVVTRAAPQLNIFAIGFPITILAGFLIVLLTLPSLTARIGEFVLSALPLIERIARI